jgi:hypothetical protein
MLLAAVCPLASLPALAAETCHESGGQYAETRLCVSSVLAPQGGKTYGPDRVTTSGEPGAWCEGAPGAGIGESITLHQKPQQPVSAIFIVNGYSDTPDVFLANGRVKKARLETSGGYKRTINLKDTPKEQMFKFPHEKLAWLRMTILEAYPGKRHQDTCVSMFYFNYEQSGLN